MQKLAVFDIDGTVFRSSLLIELTEELIDQGLLPASLVDSYLAAEIQWRDRKGPYEEYIAEVIDAFESNIAGQQREGFFRVAKAVVDEQKDWVYQYTRDLIADLKEQDYFLLAISHSPKEILDQFCEQLGFNKVYGQIYEVDARGYFTGKAMYQNIISNKAQVLRRALKKEGLVLDGSVGVGDTEVDIGFLELVEQPICFNPNKRLFDIAQRQKWKVVVERKDVIYHIQ